MTRGSQSGLEAEGLAESLAAIKAPLGIMGPGPRASVFQDACLQHTKRVGQPWPLLCQAGRTAGAFLGGPASSILPFPCPGVALLGER